MSTFVRSAIFAAAVLAGLSAAEARNYIDENGRTASQYDLNNPNDLKSFWNDQDHRGGN